MVFDVVTIQIGEKLLEPFVHDLMIRPTMVQFGQKDGATLTSFVPECGQNMLGQVSFDGFSMALVQFTRPIVGRALCTHIVASSVEQCEHLENS